MANYCQACSERLFARDHGDFAGETTADETRQRIYTAVSCAGCGYIEVDHTGRRILRVDADLQERATPDTRAMPWKTGGVSLCWHCNSQLMRHKGGFYFELVRDLSVMSTGCTKARACVKRWPMAKTNVWRRRCWHLINKRDTSHGDKQARHTPAH